MVAHQSLANLTAATAAVYFAGFLGVILVPLAGAAVATVGTQALGARSRRAFARRRERARLGGSGPEAALITVPH